MWILLLGVFALFVAAACVIVTTILLFTWKTHTTKDCQTNKDCDFSETCIAGYCAQATCKKDKDCQNGTCSNRICRLQSCRHSGDCLNNAACMLIPDKNSQQNIDVRLHGI